MTTRSRPRRSLPAVGAALLSGALLLAGCASPATPAASDDTVRYAVAGSGAAATLDPHGMLPAESDTVRMALTYDVLTLPGPDGTTAPRLATSWTPDETLTRWTIELRDDAVFSDGRPVRAADALFSLRRLEEKAAENFGRMSMFDLAASSAVDETTLELVTTAPYAEVGTALQGATFVVPEGSTDFTGAPVPGSGPFVPGGSDAQTTVFTRNDDWWGPIPPSRVIEVRAVNDPQARAQAALSGQVDLASAVPVTAAAAGEQAGLQVVPKPGATTYPVVMRTDTAPFDDPRVREAVRLAADREQLLATVFLGYGQLADDLVTPLDAARPNDLPARTRDLDRARALLAEAGHADGIDLTLATTTAYPGMDTSATLLAQQLAEIGIRVQVSVEPPDTYFSAVYGSAPFYVSFLGGIPFLDVVRVALTPGSPTNETAWDDPAWSAALATALTEPDEAARRDALGAVQADLAQRGGYLVWGAGDRIDLAAEGLTGLPEGVGFAGAFVDQVGRG